MAIPKPPKDYYSLEEVAEEWGWSVDDLVQYQEQGKLGIFAWMKSVPASLSAIEYDPSNGNTIYRLDIQDVVLNGAYPIQLGDSDWLEVGSDGMWGRIEIRDNDLESLKIQPHSAPLDPRAKPWEYESGNLVKYVYFIRESFYKIRPVITLEEKRRFEQEHAMAGNDGSKARADICQDSAFEKILNPDHPWHSINLALAVKVWLELYANKEGHKSDVPYRLKHIPGGHTELIKTGLPKLKPAAEGHLRYVINPTQELDIKKP